MFFLGVFGNSICEGMVISVLGLGISVIVLFVLRMSIVVVLKCWVIVCRFLLFFCMV